MNTNINLGSLGSSFGVLAAGLICAYGVWVGRRDLGIRGAQGILGAVALTTLLPLLLFRAGLTNVFSLLTGGRGVDSTTSLFVGASISLAAAFLSFVPLYVAVNWLEVIRHAGHPREDGGISTPLPE